MRQVSTILLFALCIPLWSAAQFSVNSAAVPISPDQQGATCFQLTPPIFYQKGSVFNNTQINLSQNFETTARLYFGTTDAGGDGIAFVFQNEGTGYIGNYGAGIGYHRFNGETPLMPVDVPGPVPSFIIEFDTYQNGGIDGQDVADPAGDHIGFMSMSNAYHSSSTQLQAPQEFSGNIEDGQWHDVKFSWNVLTKTMTVQFTVSSSPLVVQTFSYTGDIVNTIFKGNPLVYWGFTASNGSFSPNEHKICINPPPPGDCGQLRTQTPGGWGAPPRGNNPASYMYSHFAAAFPSGLTVGLVPSFNIKLTSPLSVTNFLPCAGPAKKLTANYVNPLGSDLKNVLAGHLAALTLAVRFDQTDPSFGPAGIQLGQMLIGSGAFSGWTVGNFLVEGNKVLGGGASSYTVQQALETASAINENYVDGTTDKGYLKCPNPSPRRLTTRSVGEDMTESVVFGDTQIQPNPSNGQFVLRVKKQQGTAQILIVDMNGGIIEKRTVVLNGKEQNLPFNLGTKPSGLYLIKLVTSKGEQVQKLIIQR
ncbi:MAG: lectin-like domain-containing protein [Flavisolibacter sp.]